MPDLSGAPVAPEAWLALQQTIGNHAVGGLMERRTAGQSLTPKTRHDMETSFGRDFGQVQVHSGPEVDQAAQALDAAAFTVADDIFVSSAVPSVDQPLGRAVMGEELAHVAQGVGRDGAGRITDPAETTEREAHRAGLAAAAGEHATVTSNREAQTAVARWDLSAVLGAAAQAVQAAEPTELSDEEKDRLAAGGLAPLNALWTQLGGKMASANGGMPSTNAIKAFAMSASGIGDFIASFSGPAAVQPTIEAAATATVRGRQALLAAMDPVGATKASAGILSGNAGEIDALVPPPQPAAAPGPDNTPGAAPAPAPDALTAAEAAQLKLGGAQPLRNAAEQLGGDEPDLDIILAIIKGVPSVLRSFSKPAAMVPQLHEKARNVEGQIARLEAVRGGPEAAISMAMSEWQKAIGLLQSLTAKSPAGGAPKAGEAPAGDGSGDDEDKKKPN